MAHVPPSDQRSQPSLVCCITTPFCAALHCAEPSLWLFISGYRRSRVQTRSGHTAPQPSRLQQQREPAPPRALSVWSMEVVDLTARNPTPCIGEPAGDDGRRSGVSVRRGHRVGLFRASRCSLALLADRRSVSLRPCVPTLPNSAGTGLLGAGPEATSAFAPTTDEAPRPTGVSGALTKAAAEAPRGGDSNDSADALDTIGTTDGRTVTAETVMTLAATTGGIVPAGTLTPKATQNKCHSRLVGPSLEGVSSFKRGKGLTSPWMS